MATVPLQPVSVPVIFIVIHSTAASPSLSPPHPVHQQHPLSSFASLSSPSPVRLSTSVSACESAASSAPGTLPPVSTGEAASLTRWVQRIGCCVNTNLCHFYLRLLWNPAACQAVFPLFERECFAIWLLCSKQVGELNGKFFIFWSFFTL